MSRRTLDTSRLAPGVWFVRSGYGQRLRAVTPEGRRAVVMFLLGMLGSGVVGVGPAAATGSPWWVAITVVGMAGSAAWFIATATRHTDRTINFIDLLRKNES